MTGVQTCALPILLTIAVTGAVWWFGEQWHEGNVDIGDPVDTARRYYEEGADEIVFWNRQCRPEPCRSGPGGRVQPRVPVSVRRKSGP